MVETERQVEQHLESHLERLPAGDLASRAIVEQMKDDEAGHAMARRAAPARARLPAPVRWAMRAAAQGDDDDRALRLIAVPRGRRTQLR